MAQLQSGGFELSVFPRSPEADPASFALNPSNVLAGFNQGLQAVTQARTVGDAIKSKNAQNKLQHDIAQAEIDRRKVYEQLASTDGTPTDKAQAELDIQKINNDLLGTLGDHFEDGLALAPAHPTLLAAIDHIASPPSSSLQATEPVQLNGIVPTPRQPGIWDSLTGQPAGTFSGNVSAPQQLASLEMPPPRLQVPAQLSELSVSTPAPKQLTVKEYTANLARSGVPYDQAQLLISKFIDQQGEEGQARLADIRSQTNQRNAIAERERALAAHAELAGTKQADYVATPNTIGKKGGPYDGKTVVTFVNKYNPSDSFEFPAIARTVGLSTKDYVEREWLKNLPPGTKLDTFIIGEDDTGEPLYDVPRLVAESQKYLAGKANANKGRAPSAGGAGDFGDVKPTGAGTPAAPKSAATPMKFGKRPDGTYGLIPANAQ